jgi:hypothetical protein
MTKREKFAQEIMNKRMIARNNVLMNVENGPKMKKVNHSNRYPHDVLQTQDHGGDMIVIAALHKFYTDTVNSNKFCITYITNDIMHYERHEDVTLKRALELMNEWINVELMEV